MHKGAVEGQDIWVASVGLHSPGFCQEIIQARTKPASMMEFALPRGISLIASTNVSRRGRPWLEDHGTHISRSISSRISST